METKRPAHKSKSAAAGKTVAQPVDGQPAGINFRPFSARDANYEAIQQVPPEKSKQGTVGYEMGPGERELTLMLMVKNIQEELETLKAEAALHDEMPALECLHTIAFESTRQLWLLAQYSPELVRRIAEHEAVWPVLYAKVRVAKESTDSLVETIGLGTKRTSPFDPGIIMSCDSEPRGWLAVIAGLCNRIREGAIRFAHFRNSLEKEDATVAAIITGLTGGPDRSATNQDTFEQLKLLVTHPDEICRLNALLQVEDAFKNPDTLGKLVRGSMSLPELTAESDTIAAWMQVIKQFLLDVYDGEPQKSGSSEEFVLRVV